MAKSLNQSDIQTAIRLLQDVNLRMTHTPHETAFADLIEVLAGLDEKYKEFCGGLDKFYGLPEGTTYNDEYGPSIEYYVKADDWHEISHALRTIKNRV